MLFNVHKISIKIGLSFSVTLLGLWYNYRVSVVINKVAAELKITKLALLKQKMQFRDSHAHMHANGHRKEPCLFVKEIRRHVLAGDGRIDQWMTSYDLARKGSRRKLITPLRSLLYQAMQGRMHRGSFV